MLSVHVSPNIFLGRPRVAPTEPGVRDTNVFLMFNNVIVNLIAENMCKNLTFDPLFTSLIATALSSPGTAFSELPWGE